VALAPRHAGVTALVAAGCGGDDDDDTTAATTGETAVAGGEPPSKEEFIAEADAICKQGDREINQAGRETFGEEQPSQEEQEQFVTATVRRWRLRPVRRGEQAGPGLRATNCGGG
jgi:hypothetical protein